MEEEGVWVGHSVLRSLSSLYPCRPHFAPTLPGTEVQRSGAPALRIPLGGRGETL